MTYKNCLKNELNRSVPLVSSTDLDYFKTKPSGTALLLPHVSEAKVSEVAVSIPASETDTAKRQQILDGARRCFLAQGFDGASTNDIVNRPGCKRDGLCLFPLQGKTLRRHGL